MFCKGPRCGALHIIVLFEITHVPERVFQTIQPRVQKLKINVKQRELISNIEHYI